MKDIIRFVPFQFVCCLALGVVFEYYIGMTREYVEFLPFIITGLLVLLLIQYRVANKRFELNLNFNFISYVLMFFCGICTSYIHNDLNYSDHYSYVKKEENRLILRVTKELKPDSYYTKYESSVVMVNDAFVSGTILLNIKKEGALKLFVDDQIYLSAPFQELSGPLNPGHFDYKAYLNKKNIYHQITTEEKNVLVLKTKYNSLRGLAAKFRIHVHDKLIYYGFSGDELGVINALLLGQRNFISPTLLKNYAGAGAVHILAVSGLHIGIILVILSVVLKPLERIKNGRIVKLIGILFILWVFALIAGLSASVVRAVAMFTAVAIGYELKRPNHIYATLICSIFFLVLFHPMYIFDVGFQLSYIAVFFIVWIQPKLDALWKPKWIVVNYFWKLLTVSFAAQLGVLPISLYYFHQFPGLFFLTNLLIIPVLGIVLLAGFTVIILALLNVLPQFIADSFNALIQFINTTVAYIASNEDFLFQDIPFSAYLLVTSYLCVVFGIRFLLHRTRYRFVALVVALVLLQMVIKVESIKRLQTDQLVVFHKSRYSLMGVRHGTEIEVSHTMDSISINDQKMLNKYAMDLGGLDIRYNAVFPNVIEFDSKRILIIDSLGVYQVPELNPTIVLLQQSPKINLTRVLDALHPKLVIADGSNYKSYVQRWQKTCAQKNTPFHHTGQKGAYILHKK